MFFNYSNKKGFTLIELLVVIAIMGILGGIVMTSIGNARAKARDVMRKQLGKQIQTALEMYLVENGNYPQLTTSGIAIVGVTETGSNTLNDVLVPTYMGQNISYNQTNAADASYVSNTTRPTEYVLRLSFENPTATTPSVLYTCKTGIGSMVTTYYPGVPLCTSQ